MIDLTRFGCYDGTIDPLEFLQTFKRIMSLHDASDGFMCKAFASLLRTGASDWYLRLESGSIGSFHEFGRKFLTRFGNNCFHHDPADALLALRQGRNETLRDFMVRFNAELCQHTKIDIQIVVAALKHTTTDQNLKVHLTLRPPRDLQEVESKTNKLIRAEEAFSRDRNRDQAGPSDKKKEDLRPSGRLRVDDRPANKNVVPVFERLGYAPLKVPLSHVLFAIRDQDDCYHLSIQIEKLVDEGQLNQYLRSPTRIERPFTRSKAHHRSPPHRSRSRRRSPQRSQSRHHSRDCHHTSRHHQSPRGHREDRSHQHAPDPEQPPTIAGNINIIVGGPAAGGPTTAERCAYAEHVFSLEVPSKKAWVDSLKVNQVISFSDKDYEELQILHDDAVIIRLIISNYDVGKILVDTGSSVNVLHVGTFEEMNLGEDRLGATGYYIYGFFGASVQINDKIDLPVTFGTYPLQRTVMMTSLVVDVTLRLQRYHWKTSVERFGSSGIYTPTSK
ncbi:uncharacterized protein LOC143878962 [Tasmannia lanceolata]|uniref:uncharacterized protein LOC143878962 n=1 Tax=Tasmannia lanceolata TaxID=3420 RepID=UPI00406427C0